MPVDAWVIALDPESPVVRNLQQSLHAQGIAARVFPAVDGRSGLPVLQGEERLSQLRARIHRKAALTSAEVGCYLSHYRIIRHAYEAGRTHVCIFEDDVVAEPGLGDLIREICRLDGDAHLVRLMSLKARKRKVVRRLPEGHTLVRPLRGALGAQGYVVNRTGMRKILAYGATIYLPIDKLYDSFFLFGLNCFSVEPHGIYEISRSTTVEKTVGDATPELWLALAWRVDKIYRGIRRYSHRLLKIREFFPAARPQGFLGRTERIT
jgi:glycosyl transferase family 25